MRVSATSIRGAVLLAAALTFGCEDSTGGGGPGVGDLRLLVATRGPDALELFDLQRLVRGLDSPQELPAEPLEARADDAREIFVSAFTLFPGALAYDSRVFREVPESRMEPGGFAAFDGDRTRIYLAGASLAFFDAANFSPLGFPPVDLGGEATDVVYDPGSQRIFVAVRRADGPVLLAFGADDLAEVAGSPIDLPGGPGFGTGDILLLSDRSQIFVALPEASQLAVVDPVTLGELPRTPIDLRARGRALVLDPQLERIYAGAADGSLEAVRATDFSLEGGFPRRIGGSIVDLAFDEATQQLVAADSTAREVVVLDALTLTDQIDSPIELDGTPVSVEVIDLR